MTLRELVILTLLFSFSHLSQHTVLQTLLITQTVLVTEYAGNCRNYARWK